MTLYNYWITFNDSRTGEFSRTDRDRSPWTPDIEVAKERLAKDLGRMGDGPKAVVVANYGLIEKDFDSPIILEGLFDDEGDYGEPDMVVGDKSLHQELYQQFLGNKIRLTIELVE